MNDKELRELDAWIAEHVMGFRRRQSPNSIRFEEIELPLDDGSTKWCNLNMIQNYSTNPAAAMQVLEKCIERLENDRAYPAIQKYSDLDGFQGWTVCALYERMNQRTFASVGETLPLAICLFAKQLFSKV